MYLCLHTIFVTVTIVLYYLYIMKEPALELVFFYLQEKKKV